MSKLTSSLLEKLQKISDQVNSIEIKPDDSMRIPFFEGCYDNSDEDEKLLKRKHESNTSESKQTKDSTERKDENKPKEIITKNDNYIKIIQKEITSHIEKELEIVQNERITDVKEYKLPEINNENENKEIEYQIWIMNDMYQCYGFKLQINDNKWKCCYFFDYQLKGFLYVPTYVKEEQFKDCEKDKLFDELLSMITERKKDFIPTQIIILK